MIDDVSFTILTSTEEVSVTTPSQLLPNIISDRATLAISPDLYPQNLQANIWGIDGRLHQQIELDGAIEQQLDLNGLPSGSYLLVLLATDGTLLDRLPFQKM